MNPTARSLIKLRAEGWIASVVEKWVPASPRGFAGPIVRRDVFGFGDILAVHPIRRGALLVQSTSNSGGNFSSRVAKIQASAEAKVWLESGNTIHVHGWAKRGKAGQRKVWTCRVEVVGLDALIEVAV